MAFTLTDTEVYDEDRKFPVMMAWEKPYMEHCINMLPPVGDVLEVGFGLGISATQIQKFPIRSHTIIECNTKVVEKARLWANKQPHPAHIIFAEWQNTLNILGTFDTVFFDDCFLTEHPYEHNTAGMRQFIEQIIKYHTRKTTRIGWYAEVPPSETIINLAKKWGAEYELYTYAIEKPTNVPYAQQYPNQMFVPQLTVHN